MTPHSSCTTQTLEENQCNIRVYWASIRRFPPLRGGGAGGVETRKDFPFLPSPFQFRPPFIDCIVQGTFKRGKEKSCRHERAFPALDAREMRVGDSRPRFPYES